MNSENLTKIPSSIKFPLKFNKSDQVILTIKLMKIQPPPKREFDRGIKQSFFVHYSDFYPTFTAKSDFLSFEYGTTIDVIVTPEITRTDKNLKKLDPKVRGCYFDGEKTLHFFKKYSQKNCEIECVANITLEACGCVDIDQPFKTSNDICLNISRVNPTCTNDLLSSIYIASNLSPEINCGCQPHCNSVNYNIKQYTIYEQEVKQKGVFQW